MSRVGGPRAILALALVLLALAGGAWFLARPAGKGQPEPPTALVVVLWPGLRGADLDSLDMRPSPLPHLAALASRGRIAAAHVPSSESSAAALATLLTGLEPGTHGLGSLRTPGRHALPAAVPTLPEVLASRGWRTLAALRPSHLAAEGVGLARGFGVRSGGPGGDPLEPLLAELGAALREGRNVFALLCEAPFGESPAPRGAGAAEAVRRALLPFRGRPELAAALARLELPAAPGPAPGADAALDELDELLLRRRGDPARDALLAAYRAAAWAGLDARLGRVVDEFSRTGSRSWALVVTGLAAPPLRELEVLEGAHASIPGAMQVPLVLGGVPGLGSPERTVALTRDLDLAALLARAAEGPFDGAPIPWRGWEPAPRTGAPVLGAELLSAVVWLADSAEDGAGRLVRTGPGRSLSEQPWGPRARELAEAGGRFGALELGARGLAGREVVVRSLDPRSPLHVGEGGLGRPRVVLRLGLEGEPTIGVRCERRATPLALRLPLVDASRIRIGGHPLAERDVPLLPVADGALWPAERTPVVALREVGGGRLEIAVAVPSGTAVRLVLELLSPDPQAEFPPLAGAAYPPPSVHPRRPSARLVEGRGPFTFELLPPLGSTLALAAFVEGVRVPASELRSGQRAFAGAHLELALSAFAWSDPELLGAVDARPLADPGLALFLSDPPPAGAIPPLTPALRSAIERLPEHE